MKFLHHEPIRLSDVFLQLLQSLPLAKDSRNLAQSAYIPALIEPILQRELARHGDSSRISVDCILDDDKHRGEGVFMYVAETDHDIVVRLEDGEDVHASLQSLGLTAGAVVAGIGMLREVTLAFWNGSEYVEHLVKGPVELLSLQGNLSRKEGDPFVHLHAVLGREDGTVVGGHLMKATVHETNEIVIRKLLGVVMERREEPSGLFGLYPHSSSGSSAP